MGVIYSYKTDKKHSEEIECCGCGKKGVHFINCPNCQGEISEEEEGILEKIKNFLNS